MTLRGARKTVVVILVLQIVVTLAVAIASLAVVDVRAGYSALIGGGINVFATLYYARVVFSAGPGATAARVARAFYLGEVAKIVLTIVLFVFVLSSVNVAPLQLFIAYAASMLAFWLALPLAT